MAPHANNSSLTNPYLLNKHGLTLGHEIKSFSSPNKTFSNSVSDQAHGYHPLPGVYTARDLVKLSLPILRTVIVRLDRSSPSSKSCSDVLVAGLAACLSTTTRESTFPRAASGADNDSARKEITSQANRIGKTLVDYTQQALNEPSPSDWRISSRCENHLWTHPAAALLLGPRSSSDLMELYNEWLHRMVLLRDSLLPFENYEDVPIVIGGSGKQMRGLRAAETPRKSFLLQCLSGGVSHISIVDFAKTFTAPELPSGGYGFQYGEGVVLPAYLSGSSTRYLLRYHPARVRDDDGQGGKRLSGLFEYEYPSYREAKTELPVEDDGLCERVDSGKAIFQGGEQTVLADGKTEAFIGVTAGSEPDLIRLSLDLKLGGDDSCVSVDVGQISRGVRFAYSLPRGSNSEKDGAFANGDSWVSATSQWKGEVFVHQVDKTLRHPGLLVGSTPGQIHVFPAANELMRFALLGKLYPENLILYKDGGMLAGVEKTGKGFSSRLLIV